MAQFPKQEEWEWEWAIVSSETEEEWVGEERMNSRISYYNYKFRTPQIRNEKINPNFRIEYKNEEFL